MRAIVKHSFLQRTLLCGLVLFVPAVFAQGNSGSALGGGPANNATRVPLTADWTDHAVVFSENATGARAVAASQTGTFTASNGTGTVTVNGTGLTASAGTAASKGGTFTAQPGAGAVTITNGSTLTVTNGGTAKTVTGTF